MKSLRALLCAFALVCLLPVLHAQSKGFIPVTGLNTRDASGALISNATISFAPTDAAGKALPFKVANYGQSVQSAITAEVTGGVFTAELADTSTTSPTNICYAVSITDNLTGNLLLNRGYGCVQMSASWCSSSAGVFTSCDFDNYPPDAVTIPLTTFPSISIGSVTGGDEAGAALSGSDPNYTLSLTLPKGDTGAAGPAGPAGYLPSYTPPEKTNVTPTWQNKINKGQDTADFGAAGAGDASQGNDCEALELAIQAAANGVPGASKTIDIYHPLHCTMPLGYALLPRDYGDYLSIYAGSGATVGLTVTGGHITACSVGGGLDAYNPNAYLPVRVTDPTYQGSGGVVHVTTDSTGTPNACVVDLKGWKYPVEGTMTTVYPIGADGATASCTLTSGAMGACAVGTGGWGYTSFPASGFPVGSSLLQCTSYPTVTGTVSNDAVATVTSTVGTGCTYNGASSATVPVCIGACVNGVQATNIAPETPQVIPIAIPLRAGISIDCHGNSIQTAYWSGTTDLNQMVVFGDPWGDQGQGVTIKNWNIGGFGGVWFAGKTTDVHLLDNHFAAQPNGFTGVTSGYGASFGVFIAQAGLRTEISGNTFLGNASVIVGGMWSSRTGGGGGLGSIGGTAINYTNTAAAGGSADGLQMLSNNIWSTTNLGSGNYIDYWSIFQQPQRPDLGTAFNFSPTPGGSEGYSYNAALDTFFEQYVWQSQNSPLANAYAPNGQGTCYSSLTTNSRATDFNFGNVAARYTTDPWFPCYRGVTDMGLVALSRYGYASQVNVNGLTVDFSSRPVILGSFTNSTVSDVAGYYFRSYTDPYIPAGALEPGLVDVEVATTSTGSYTAIKNNDTARARFSQTLSVTSDATEDLSQSTWDAITPVAAAGQYSSSRAGWGIPTVTLGTAVGSAATTPATTPACVNGYQCTSTVSDYYFTSGSTTAAGTLATITLPLRATSPICTAIAVQGTTTTTLTVTTLSATSVIVTTPTALTASTLTYLKLNCGGI